MGRTGRTERPPVGHRSSIKGHRQLGPNHPNSQGPRKLILLSQGFGVWKIVHPQTKLSSLCARTTTTGRLNFHCWFEPLAPSKGVGGGGPPAGEGRIQFERICGWFITTPLYTHTFYVPVSVTLSVTLATESSKELMIGPDDAPFTPVFLSISIDNSREIKFERIRVWRRKTPTSMSLSATCTIAGVSVLMFRV